MPKFARGNDALAAADAAKGGGRGKFTPFISIKPGEKKYLQFLTPTDEISGALLHQFVITEYRDDNSPVYNNFISPRDKMLDGAGGYDEIESRFGLRPIFRLFALAVEMEPVTKKVAGKLKTVSFTPVMRTWTDREEEEHESVQAGIVIQSKDNFFSHLFTWQEETDDDMTTKIWSVTRDSNKQKPTYSFVPSNACDALDLSEYADDMPDLDAFLDEISDPQRYTDLISPLPDDHKISSFPPKSAKAGKSTSTRPRPRAQEAEESEEDFQTNEEKAADKGAKWDRLRSTIKEKEEATEEDDE